MRAYVCACVCACVRACVRACVQFVLTNVWVHVHVCVNIHTHKHTHAYGQIHRQTDRMQIDTNTEWPTDKHMCSYIHMFAYVGVGGLKNRYTQETHECLGSTITNNNLLHFERTKNWPQVNKKLDKFDCNVCEIFMSTIVFLKTELYSKPGLCMCVYVCEERAHVCTYSCVGIYAYLFIYLHVCVRVCVCVYVRVFVYTYMYTYTYIDIYKYIHIYI